jgi:hypothetical protein
VLELERNQPFDPSLSDWGRTDWTRSYRNLECAARESYRLLSAPTEEEAMRRLGLLLAVVGATAMLSGRDGGRALRIRSEQPTGRL